jgi:outer membrane protein OmpA-like peptidoglycan-associated protein/tetratricopeptide (TPR) repeat protein
MRIIFYLTVLTLISSFALAQSNSSLAYQALADSLYQHHNYQHAADYFQKALKNSANTADIMLHVGRCYNKLNRIQEAEIWFRKADENNAEFTNDDMIQYIQVLMMSKKRKEAETMVASHLKNDPQSLLAKQLLDDLRNYDKYLADSLAYDIKPLSINTSQSEFAPAFHKSGIVFSASKQRGMLKKKYHWDNSHFLNLYYSQQISAANFKEPVLLEDKLNARFHDGPVSFYKGGERMIITRNHHTPTPGKKNSFVWHLALFDAYHEEGKQEWTLSLLPFNEQGASQAHPAISEDGTVLYFISDRPGGYGGTDIYRIVSVNGVWGKPFNLGPAVNTPGNEVFPFFVNNTLYFASNGHGGLGGLDIFSSMQTVNGFAKPVNMGYPINTHLDDFSFITSSDEQSGFFASTRDGNDDLFMFSKRPKLIDMMTHVYDGKTKESLATAEVQIITDTHDTTMTADQSGVIRFQLPRESAFVLIGSKDSKTGMLSDFAGEGQSTQELALYGDTTRIPCIVMIKDAEGLSSSPSSVSVIDKNTGKPVENPGDQSMISFLGEKGHTYKVEIKNEQGDTTSLDVRVPKDGTETKTWSMALKEVPKSMDMAVRVVSEHDATPLPKAQVKVVTFSDSDQDLITNENGVVEFSLQTGSAYMVIATSAGLTGMHSGMAEVGNDKSAIVHTLVVKGDMNKQIPIVILVTDTDGKLLDDAKVVVTDRKTGEILPSEQKDGAITFLGNKGSDYQVSATKEGHQVQKTDISIPADAKEVEKINVTLEEKLPYQIAARVINTLNHSNVSGAEVKLMTLDADDVELTSDSVGIVNFTLREGTAFVAMASKNGLTGMLSGIVEPGTDKNSMIHSIEVQGDSQKQLPVVTFVTDTNGEMLEDAKVKVTEKISGDSIHSEFNDGVLSFFGEKGKSYDISVKDEGHKASAAIVSIPQDATQVDKVNIELKDKRPMQPTIYQMAARVVKANDNTAISGAQVKIMTLDSEDVELTTDNEGVVNFTLAEGTAYVAMATKDNMTGMHSGIAEKGAEKSSLIHSISVQGDSKKQLPIVRVITNDEGVALNDAKVKVTEKISGDSVASEFNDGILSFSAERGKAYDISVKDKGYKSTTTSIAVPQQATTVEMKNIELQNKRTIQPVPYQMAARVFSEKDKSPLSGANVKLTTFEADDLDLVADSTGLVTFTLIEGTAYVITASGNGLIGMISGIVETGTDSASVIHSIYAKGDNRNLVPVVGLLSASNDEFVDDTKLKIVDESNRKEVDFTHNRGVVTFMGEKGHSYELEAITGNDTHQIKNIKVDATPALPVEWQLELHDNSNDTERLIIFNNHTIANRYFLIRNNVNYEITAKDNALYLQNDSTTIKLCEGTLDALDKDPELLIEEEGLTIKDIVRVKNIYFDFDKATLHEKDKTELDKVALVLERASTYIVQVNAHADGRGGDNYNQRLSERRAESIINYLRKKKISTARLISKGCGEKVPFIKCEASKCSEDEHQQNRRAEFDLIIMNDAYTSKKKQ